VVEPVVPEQLFLLPVLVDPKAGLLVQAALPKEVFSAEELSLQDAIHDDPRNDGPRLAFAYWLNDRGRSNRGYNGLLNFDRFFWNGARSAELVGDLQSVADENQALLRGEPAYQKARVSTLDILDKLLWKANGSATIHGGDKQQFAAGKRIVVQVKARSHGRPWSAGPRRTGLSPSDAVS